jgi:hypothetical protein
MDKGLLQPVQASKNFTTRRAFRNPQKLISEEKIPSEAIGRGR